MARISTYKIDNNIVAEDKVIGTDSTGSATKNYDLGGIATWLKASGNTAVAVQNDFLFQAVANPDSPNLSGRDEGTISFKTFGGDGTAFQDLDTQDLLISEKSVIGTFIVKYTEGLVGSPIVLAQLDDLNQFGVFNLEKIEASLSNPGFYNIKLTHIQSNGAIIDGKRYGIGDYNAYNNWNLLPRTYFSMVSAEGTNFLIAIDDLGNLFVLSGDSTSPQITPAPVLTGEAEEFSPLTAVLGTVTGDPLPTESFTWQRSTDGITGWADITPQPGVLTYVLGVDDRNKFIRLRQYAINLLGSEERFSNVIGPIIANIFSATQWQLIQSASWDAITSSTWN